MSATSLPRIALICPGLGEVQRGFERFFGDLFVRLQAEVDVTLFRGGREPSARERTPFFLRRNGRLLRWVPLHRLIRRTPMHAECLSMALSVLPALARERYDVVHVIDPPLARLLYHLRETFDLPFRLLFSEGTAMPPGDYPPADATLHMSQSTYDRAIAWGHPRERSHLLPCGIWSERFSTGAGREALRRRHHIPESTFVVLCVAALNRGHKRVDHLVAEFSRLQGDCLLWLDGSLDHGDPGLRAEAERRLGSRVRVTHVPSAQVAELYRMADVKVLPSLFEAFGLAAVEAMAAGTPVLVHDCPHFRWLLGDPGNLVDMATPGRLSARLEHLRGEPEPRAALRHPERIREKLDWNVLGSAYIDFYRRVAALPALRRRSLR